MTNERMRAYEREVEVAREFERTSRFVPMFRMDGETEWITGSEMLRRYNKPKSPFRSLLATIQHNFPRLLIAIVVALAVCCAKHVLTK